MTKPWPMVPLGELLRLERRPIKVVADGQYAEIGIYCFGRGIFHKTPRSGLEVGNKDLFLVKEGDFILQVTFAWEGAVGLASPAEDAMYGSTRFPTFRVDESRCFPPYLVQYFKTHEGREQLVKISPGSAGRNRVLSLKRIPEVLVPLPPLSEQKRIVARIEELAAKIEEAKGLRQKAIEEAEALFNIASRFLFKDLKTKVGYRELSVEQCCETIIDYRGRTPPIADEGIPHLTSANIKDGHINWSTSKYVSEETYQSFMTRGIPQVGDVIFTMEAPLGEAAVVPDNRLFSLAQRTLLLRANKNIAKERFLARAIKSPEVREKIYSKATGTTVKGIASKRLKQIMLPIPPVHDQRRIVAYLDDLQAKVDSVKRLQAGTEAELDAMLPSVLDRAFKGEL